MQRLAAEEGGDEEAVGAERAAGLDELADGVVRPVQREAVQDEVVRALLEGEGLVGGRLARRAEAGGGQRLGPEGGAGADDRRGGKACG